MRLSALRRSVSFVVAVATVLSWSVASAQQACAPGRFASTQTGACEECVVGRYQPAIGQEACFQCEPGRFTDVSGRTTCDACGPGRFQGVSGQTTCDDCAEGSARDATGQTSCALCGPGRYSPTRGQTTCNACDPGRYSDTLGARECLPCAPGRFATDGAATCSACAPGRFAHVDASTTCESCGPGRYSDTTEATQCSACPPGRYSGATVDALGATQWATTCTAPNTYNCYKTKDKKNPVWTVQPTTIEDKYTFTVDAKVKAPTMVCAPVDVGSGVEDPSKSQCCYKVSTPGLAKPHPQVRTSGGTFTGSELEVLKSQMICEPCVTDPAP